MQPDIPLDIPSTFWSRLTARIPSVFFKPTIRFTLLRTICVSAFVLIWNVPTQLWPYITDCNWDQLQNPEVESMNAYHAMRRTVLIFAYLLCSLTIVHHFTSAFGPRFGLPGILDFAFLVTEAILFTIQAVTRTWDAILPDTNSICVRPHIQVSLVAELFTWVTALSLLLLTTMRLAEALESNGRYFWARYDITGLSLSPRRAQYETGKPNGIQILGGLSLWKPHFVGEGVWIVRSRAIIALIFAVLALGFAISTVVIDPSLEASQTPKMVTTTAFYAPFYWMALPVVDLIIGVEIPHLPGRPYTFQPLDLSPAINVQWAVPTNDTCEMFNYGKFSRSITDEFGFYYTVFRCSMNMPLRSDLGVNVNFTSLNGLVNITDLPTENMLVQVIVGHIPNNNHDVSRIIRRTTAPVILLPGMNVLGFAQQHREQVFSNTGLSTLGFFAATDYYWATEVINVQSNHRANTSNDTASLVVVPMVDFTDTRVVQDHRDKSILKGLSSVGGLWTLFAGIFLFLFGSELINVVFGGKRLTIFGLAHSVLKERTRQGYRETYPQLQRDMALLSAKPGLMALLVHHLVDLGLLNEDRGQTFDLSNERKEDKIESPSTDSPIALEYRLDNVRDPVSQAGRQV